MLGNLLLHFATEIRFNYTIIMTNYKSAPIPSTKMPGGVPYIIGNETAERFSFYGMKTILVIFMTKYLMDQSGALDVMNREEALTWYHLFSSGVYFTPILGALIADGLLGKYRTIIFLSLVYCLGHLVLSLDDTRFGLSIGLGLIAMGSGGIKPCVSAHVGDQFGKTNSHLLEKVFSWFYFSINFGAFFSTLATPILLEKYGPNVAFGIPGVLMFIATFVFWMGRKKFIHIPPGGMNFIKEITSKEGLSALARLTIIYVFVAIFWSLFDQTGSSWVLQADQMDRNWLGVEWLPSQVQAVNPILILIFIPLFNYFIFPTVSKRITLTPLRKIGFGLFLTAPSFLIIGYAQSLIDTGQTPGIYWQIIAYGVITAAEVLVSITCLEFSYSQAPKTMKSVIMSYFFLSLTLGNLVTAGVNIFIQNPDGSLKIEGADYFYFFGGLMFVTAVLFTMISRYYQPISYFQEEGA